MTRDEIIAMAREAGIDEWWDSGNEHREVLQEHLERFANLIAAEIGIETHRRGYESGLRDGAAAEREACARVLKEMAAQDKRTNYYAVAARAIRERGNKA